jgi:hypothetical protein
MMCISFSLPEKAAVSPSPLALYHQELCRVREETGEHNSDHEDNDHNDEDSKADENVKAHQEKEPRICGSKRKALSRGANIHDITSNSNKAATASSWSSSLFSESSSNTESHEVEEASIKKNKPVDL